MFYVQEVLDAKLSEFKERLSGKRTPTEPHRLTGNVRFTPVPNKNLTKNTNTENMVHVLLDYLYLCQKRKNIEKVNHFRINVDKA